MNWTAEQDEQLRTLHAKRVGVSFIGSWMRWPTSEVRTRLVELGLAKPSPRVTSVAEAAKFRKSAITKPPATLCAVQSLHDAFDDEQELKTKPGCQRGHLLPESEIAALYRAVGCTY